MIQFCVHTGSSNFLKVVDWLVENKIKYEPHLNRTRFWIDPDSPEMLMFMLSHREHCDTVYEDEDLVTGQRIQAGK